MGTGRHVVRNNYIKKYSTWFAGALDVFPMVDCLT